MRHATICTYVLAALLAGLTAGGCDQPAQQSDELLILCGNSFVEPTEKLESLFEAETGIHITHTIGGSEDLYPHVKEHSEGDLFVTHDPFMDNTKEADSLLRAVQVGYVVPVIVVPKGSDKGIEKFEDLAKPGLQVILPNPEYSTCGEMVFALLDEKDKEDPGFKEAVLKNVGNAMFRSHSEIGNQMKLGNGDAAIMWKGVAYKYPDSLEIVPTEYEYGEDVRVWMIGLSYSPKKEKIEKFLDFVDKHGKEVFEEFGYVK